VLHDSEEIVEVTLSEVVNSKDFSKELSNFLLF